MFNKTELILLTLVLGLVGCNATQPIKPDNDFLKQTLAGKSLHSISTNEAYVFLPGNKLIYANGNSGEKRTGSYFIKKAQHGSDVLCMPTGATLVESTESRCIEIYPGRTSDWLGRETHVVKLLRCSGLSYESTRCVAQSSLYPSYVVHDNIEIEARDLRFKAQKDFTVLDQNKGLQWMRCTFGEESILNVPCMMTQHLKTTYASRSAVEKSINAFNAKGFAGHHDWRLPTRTELASLLQCNSDSDRGECKKIDYMEYTTTIDLNKITLADPIFSTHQGRYLTADTGTDKQGRPTSGFVNFDSGHEYMWSDENAFLQPNSNESQKPERKIYVRLVRDAK